MARKTKSDAQKAHEARNNALRVEANKRRRKAKSEGKAAFKANIAAMKKLGKKVRSERAAAHARASARPDPQRGADEELAAAKVDGGAAVVRRIVYE